MTDRITELETALGDILRIVEAQRLTTGLGKGQHERVTKAKALLAARREHNPPGDEHLANESGPNYD